MSDLVTIGRSGTAAPNKKSPFDTPDQAVRLVKMLVIQVESGRLEEGDAHTVFNWCVSESVRVEILADATQPKPNTTTPTGRSA